MFSKISVRNASKLKDSARISHRLYQTNVIQSEICEFNACTTSFAVPKYRTPHVLSHTHGACDVPLISSSLGYAFDESVRKYADRNFVTSVFQPLASSLTYAEVADKVDAIALSLIGLGFERGDRLAIWSANNVEWLWTMYACAKIGVVLVNLNPAYKPRELEYTLNKVKCKGLVFAHMFKDDSNLTAVQQLVPEAAAARFSGDARDVTFSAYAPLSCARVPSLQHLIHLGTEHGAATTHSGVVRGMLRFTDLLDASLFASDAHRVAYPARRERCDADDVINIQFTSGTTGFPKAAALTHTNVLNNGFFVGETLQLSERDKVLLNVPLFHCFGMVMGSIAATTHGSSLILPAPLFSASQAVAAAARHSASVYHGVPTMFIAMLAASNFAEHQPVIKKHGRTGIMAGSPCPEAVMRAVIERMGVQATICYGMTETSPVSLQTHLDDPLERKVATVGRALPHIEVKVVDEEGRTVPVGSKGELCTRGYSVMRGYWDGDDVDATLTSGSVRGGWMSTGDEGVMDADGFVQVTGRIKDLIIRGGENVQPREIEEVLYTHAKVRDAQVIGVPDAVYGEQVGVWVVVKEGEEMTVEEVQAHVAATLAKYKVPQYVKFVQSFPMTVSGKVQKYLMREQYARELGKDAIFKK